MVKEKNIVAAKGERLYLSPMKMEDAAQYARWQNDPQVYGQIRDMNETITVEDQSRWMLETLQDPAQRVFSIYYLPDDKMIGQGGFKNLDTYDKSGEVWLAIGETSYWRQGLGTEARWLLCKYGFEKLGLNNILGEHYATNPVSLHNAKKTGARVIGVRRRCKWVDGEFIDATYTDLLPHELIKPKI
jgi:RimJ/RimL family protein N-acetyltransferase